jgi:nitroimidazol reductase NimA-like FMN-containing flavoprotein (pyridoxamine 5'-phosphate oxidase superfamily)
MAQITDFENFLEETTIPLRLACTTETGWPIVLSLWFIYKQGKLYCATQSNAKVVTYLKDNPSCAYEVAGDFPPYCGIRGQAVAEIDEKKGQEILKELLSRYLGGSENKLSNFLLDEERQEVALILKPINCFSWNFSSRMDDLDLDLLRERKKICP